jgi:3-methylcrotonyl-CoA carboxylase alpha subunit
MPFASVLIANRGEIACRIIRSCRKLGIRTVAVYSDADARAQHAWQADVAVHIGGSAPRDSYLRGEAIIQAALDTGAQAIHPGYGFLSENADFADAVVAAGLVFIGPSGASMRKMGSKAGAKELMACAPACRWCRAIPARISPRKPSRQKPSASAIP